MKKVTQFLGAALLCVLAGCMGLNAQTNLSIQGTIQNFDGSAVDNGSYDVIFKLYTTDVGGAAVWSETQSAQVTGGVYSVLLGSVNPLTVPFDQTYYLGITLPGGPELTPRSRLTSSPYALSVIGQTNVFPSTGAVGVGTNAPAAGYQLHINAAAGDGKMLVEGVNSAKIDLKKGANTAEINYDGSALNMPGTVNIGTLNATNFSYNPSNMAISSKLAVGQGGVDPDNALKVTGNSFLSGFVEIDGVKALSWPGGRVHSAGDQSNFAVNAQTTGYTLRVQGRVWAAEVWAGSDRRIKKDFHRSEKVADLSALRRLQVTDYRHVDEIAKGSAFKKGFIAQEVESVFPEAVSVSSEFIPNVYALAAATKSLDGQMAVYLDKKHDFAVGDEVKLMIAGNEQKLVVAKVLSETAFSVKWTNALPEQVFVYGKKVSDFHSVDYDRIFTLNVSATQELARRVEQLEAENALLRQHNEGLQKKTDSLQQQNEGLRSDLNGLGERLLKLEKQGMNRLEK